MAIEKAAELSEYIGPVYVAVAHEQYHKAMKKLSNKLDLPLNKREVKFDLPFSMNNNEYVDAAGGYSGVIKNGSKIKTNLHSLKIENIEEQGF